VSEPDPPLPPPADPDPTRSDGSSLPRTHPAGDPDTSSNWFGSVVGPETPHPDAADLPPPAAAVDPAVGTVVGDRYRLFRRVGRGGMAVVYAARDQVLNRAVAVKMVRYDRVRPDMYAELAHRFDREARITCQLQHPGIPAVHDLGTLPDGRPFMVMKLVKGCTLADMLKERAKAAAQAGPDLAQWLQTFEQLCLTVGYAHSRDVIHRDLSPHNVMIGAFGEVQVMDWGLAKVLTDRPPEPAPPADVETVEEGLTVIDPVRAGAAGAVPGETNAAVGKFWYMPPEQAREEDVKRVDRRADVFGLGAILCEVLTGKPPYCNTDPEEQWAEAMLWRTEPAFERLDGCGADPELVAVCKQCLAKDPADRPADAAAVAAAVGNYRAGVQDRLHRAEVERATAQAREAEARVLAEAREHARQAAEARAQAEATAADEARAKAREQKRRRRTQLTFFAVTIPLLGSLVAGVWWREHEKTLRAARDAEEAHAREIEKAETDARADARAEARRKQRDNIAQNVGQIVAAAPEPDFERARNAERGANIALTNSAALRREARKAAADPDEWAKLLADARASLREAEFWLEAGAGSDEGRGRVKAERAALDAADRERVFVTRLDTVAGFIGMKDAPRLVPGWYAVAFKQNGLDVLDDRARSADECGKWVLAHPHADDLLVALTDWLSVGSLEVREANRLEDVIAAAVPKTEVFAPVRAGGLRQQAALEALARDPARLPPRMIEFVAIRLRMVNREEVAAQLLRRGIILFPRDARLRLRFVEDPTRLTPAGAEEAIHHLSVAAFLRPNSPAAHLKLGTALARLGRHDDAVASLRRAHAAFDRFRAAEPELKTAADDPLVMAELGTALARRGQVTGNEADYREAAWFLYRAVGRDPDDYEMWSRLGTAVLGYGNLDGAEICFENAIESAPQKWADGHVGLGLVRARRRQPDAALEAFREAARRDPANLRAQTELGKELHRRQLFAEAEGAFGRATDAAPTDAEAWYFRGDCLRRLDRPDAALACYREAFRLDRRDPAFLRDLLTALDGRTAPGESARVYAALFKAEPSAATTPPGTREKAVRSALKAGFGPTGEVISPGEREELRRLALEWLRAELRAAEAERARGGPGAADRVRMRLEGWAKDPDVAATRNPWVLWSLPAKERAAWVQFWTDVAELADALAGRGG
jgi:tetratricopeptide (TPR) repeat protein/tRNA A-37 threonylcarbamoyl transferase component Bud32